MKVIDIFNKAVNGEELPKKIAIQNEVLIYNEDEILNLQDYYYMADDEDATWKIWAYRLDDEVEIIEEEKKIPEKLEYQGGFGGTDQEVISEYVDDVVEKVNEIIDYLQSKGE